MRVAFMGSLLEQDDSEPDHYLFFPKEHTIALCRLAFAWPSCCFEDDLLSEVEDLGNCDSTLHVHWWHWGVCFALPSCFYLDHFINANNLKEQRCVLTLSIGIMPAG